MSATPPFERLPVAARHASRPAWRIRSSALSPLARDVIVILLAKAAVLTLIWLAFFSHPAAPGMSMEPQRVESRLLAPPAATEATDAFR